MEKKGLIKKILIPAVILIVIVAAYFLFLKDSELINSVATPPDEDFVRIEREILTLLSDLQELSLSAEVFESDTFRSFVDFSVDLTPEPVGRDYPFAPIGVGSSGSL